MKQIFPYGKPVIGKDLIDRKDITKTIMNDLIGGQSVILTAPRRYGKTSVIHECLSKLKSKNCLTGYIDLFEKASIRELAEGIVETTLKNDVLNASKILKTIKTNLSGFLKMVQFKHIWQEHEFILSFGSKEADEISLLNEALGFPEKYAQSKKRKMIFAIDEFGDLKNMNGQLLKKLRAKYQLHKQVTYIFSGSQESVMKELFTNKNYAFYGFGKIIELGPLPRSDLYRYFTATLKKANFPVDKGAIEHICELTNNHPHYSKILAQATLEQMDKKRKIRVKDVDEGFERAFFQVKGEMDREWESLSKAPLQRRVLKFLVQKNKGLYAKGSFSDVDKQQIYFALTELQNKGMIQKTGKGIFIFANPFFKDYILRMGKYM